MSGPVEVEPAASLEEVLALYDRWAADPYDEEVSQLDHALQTAARAEAAGAPDELVVAALLHDVGHLLDLAARDGAGRLPEADLGHEATGARYLGRLYGPAVTAPIALHVRAKRYLAATEPGYLDELSDGSRRSLTLQGGPLAPEEVAGFEANPRCADALVLRRCDDGGKVVGEVAPSLRHHLDRLRACLRTG